MSALWLQNPFFELTNDVQGVYKIHSGGAKVVGLSRLITLFI